MTHGLSTGAVTILCALIACAGVVLAAVIQSGVLTRRKLDTASADAAEKIEEIHVLVNSRLSQALARIDQLSEKLGIESVEALDDP